MKKALFINRQGFTKEIELEQKLPYYHISVTNCRFEILMKEALPIETTPHKTFYLAYESRYTDLLIYEER